MTNLEALTQDMSTQDKIAIRACITVLACIVLDLEANDKIDIETYSVVMKHHLIYLTSKVGE